MTKDGLYNFMNNVRIITDEADVNRESLNIGFEDFGHKDNERGYFSLDEAEEIYDKKLATENLYKDENGHLHLKNNYLQQRTAFTVVNGMPSCGFEDEMTRPLIEYAKRFYLVYDCIVPVNMLCGIKMLSVANNKYIFTYTVDRTKIISNFNPDFIEQLCIGIIKRSANYFTAYSHDDIKEKQYDFKCSCVNFNANDLKLTFTVDKNTAFSTNCIAIIKSLDAELFVSLNKWVNNEILTQAVHYMIIDSGQQYMISKDNEDIKSMNIYWANKDFPDYNDVRID